MQIVVSADIGEFGPTDGEPVTYHFNSLYHAQGMIPWLLLPLAFVVLRENRTARAAWILAPIALVATVYLVVIRMMRVTSGSTAQLHVIFTVIVVGFSLVWLLAERIGHRNRFVTFLLASLIYFGFLGVTLLANGCSEDVTAIAGLTAVSLPAILLALFIASPHRTKPFHGARFVAWVGGTLFLALLVIFSTIMFVFYRAPGRSVEGLLRELLIASFLSSLIYYAALLPFLVLLLANPFWRKRLGAVLGIQTEVPS